MHLHDSMLGKGEHSSQDMKQNLQVIQAAQCLTSNTTHLIATLKQVLY
jgi:septum formation topological specificity factor MinE